MKMDDNHSNKKISLNGKQHDLNIVNKRKDFAIICRNAGHVIKNSPDFELNNLANLIDDIDYESLITLMICQHTFCGNIKAKEILAEVSKKLPQSRTNIICIVSDFFSTSIKDEDRINLLSKPILAYFFANLAQQNKIYEAGIFNANFNFDDSNFIEKEGERLCKELGIINCQYDQSLLLLLGSNETYFLLTSLLKKIMTKVPKQHHMSWMYIFTEYIQVVNSEKSIDDITNIMAIRITGPNISSWTESFFYKISIEEFLCKLNELKQKIKLKRHAFGFFYFPKCLFDRPEESSNIPGVLFSDPPELVENYQCDHRQHLCCLTQKAKESINKIFPNIPFIGIHYYSLLCNEEGKIAPEFEDINSIFIEARGHSAYKYGSLMIITYD